MHRVRGAIGFLVAVAAGMLLSITFDLRGAVTWPGYLVGATTLLALGLLGSTHQISIDELRRNRSTVLIAVSAGVVAKALLISAVMYVVFRDPAYLVLGVAVAQIDPLSVAARSVPADISPRTRSLLSAWASFDDPVTTLLAVYLSAFVLWQTGRTTALPAQIPSGIAALVSQAALNLGLAAAVYLLWRAYAARFRRVRVPESTRRMSAVDVVLVLVLVGAVAAAVAGYLMLGIALVGLFYRPAVLERVLPAVAAGAFLVAAFALGLVVARGIDLVAGLLLGVAAYLAQVVVGLVVAARLPRRERWYIALAQQNGITAIILSLLLEPVFPGTVAVVAPAIVVVNILHAAANAGVNRRPG